MEARIELLQRVKESSAHTQERVRSFLRTVEGHDVDRVDLATVPMEVVHVLYVILDGRIPPTPRDESIVLFEDYKRDLKKKLGPTRYTDLLWLNRRAPAPTKSLRSRIDACKTNGWISAPPLYVKPITHNGRDVGLGLFCMIPIFRGQMICQFTGRVHAIHGATKQQRDKNQRLYYQKNSGRLNYAILMDHGIHSYIVNPLTEADTHVKADNIAAYMNEPSPPQGTVVHVNGRNAVVMEYDFKTATYDVEYADGRRERVDRVGPHPLTPSSTVANAMWYDFPVPLRDLYVPTGRTRGSGYEYRFTGKRQVVLQHTNVPQTFAAYSDTTGVYQIGSSHPPPVKSVVLLKEHVHRGLDRAGLVLQSSRTGLHVSHTVASHTWWRLPKTILVGKVKRCASCKANDDPSCTECHSIPFPTVHACTDIPKDHELLCLYSKPTATRGSGCTDRLDSEDFCPHMLHV